LSGSAHIRNLNEKQINPDIFRVDFESRQVADDKERGALGMHYTSRPNILKVPQPAFFSSNKPAPSSLKGSG